MRRYRLAWPHRTDFLSGAVAHGEHKIHLWRSRFCKFVPTLAPQAFGRQSGGLERMDRVLIDAFGGVTSGAEGTEIRFAPVLQNGLGQNGARGIPGAEKQETLYGASMTFGGHLQQAGPQQDAAATAFFARMNALMNLSLICGPTTSASRPAAVKNSRASSTW